jgi:hypothetical protein
LRAIILSYLALKDWFWRTSHKYEWLFRNKNGFLAISLVLRTILWNVRFEEPLNFVVLRNRGPGKKTDRKFLERGVNTRLMAGQTLREFPYSCMIPC